MCYLWTLYNDRFEIDEGATAEERRFAFDNAMARIGQEYNTCVKIENERYAGIGARIQAYELDLLQPLYNPTGGPQNAAFALAVSIWKAIKKPSPADIATVGVSLQKLVSSYLADLDAQEAAWNAEYGQRADGVMRSEWTNYRQFDKWKTEQITTHTINLGKCALAHNAAAMNAANGLGIGMNSLVGWLKP